MNASSENTLGYNSEENVDHTHFEVIANSSELIPPINSFSGKGTGITFALELIRGHLFDELTSSFSYWDSDFSSMTSDERE